MYFVVLLGLTTLNLNFIESQTVFPPDFKFGVATSSYQIEGGWNEDGKGENIWDHLCHTDPNSIVDHNNGDIACDSYNKIDEDIAIIKALGVDFYRFSLSWSRILPNGRPNSINEAGINYYNKLIKGLLAEDIEPVVTLYHWDLPQALEEVDGWLNPNITIAFEDYARIVFEQFGEMVKTWITINEPKQVCQGGYGEGSKAPGIQSSGLKEYICTHNLIKAHANVWHLYDKEFRPKYNGRISITIDSPWLEPISNSTQDLEATERARQFMLGWFANPIYNRNYPQVMIDRIGNLSQQQGYNESRLPTFTEEELNYISGTYDFFGLNVYTAVLVFWLPDLPMEIIGFFNDLSVGVALDPQWEISGNPFFKVVPWAIRKLVNWIKDTYNDPEIIITENGYVDLGEIEDEDRIHYHKEYLRNLLAAMVEDNVTCTAYTAWSLMDNFEWNFGYTNMYGLYHIDFNDPNRTRVPKLSAAWYANVTRTHDIE